MLAGDTRYALYHNAKAKGTGWYGEIGTTCEPRSNPDKLLEALMEPAERQARRLAAEAVGGALR
jgi:hypothetical protein